MMQMSKIERLQNRPHSPSKLKSAFDLNSFWDSFVEIIDTALPYEACELFFDFDGFQPRRALYHSRKAGHSGYRPPVSLSIAAPYLQRNPREKLYSYSQIARTDPEAPQRRDEQKKKSHEWKDFVQSAFWRDGELEAVISIGWDSLDKTLPERAMDLLRGLYFDVETALRRLRMLDHERLKYGALEQVMLDMPIPVMLIDGDGELLFCNARARAANARWNAALPRTSEPLPASLSGMIEDRRSGDDPAWVGQIRHPGLENFWIRVGVSWGTPSIRSSPCYVVTFVENDDTYAEDKKHLPGKVDQSISALQSLSPRERHVAILISQGLRNAEIAQKLVRSRRTIEFQVASIFRKLNISNRVQLVRLMSV
jgi:DNA-binding CsgD family transcriptional regulator/PAS domain-containing protein